MPINKERISSPLEAGSSLLEVKQLPPQLTSALEYVSSRLARKCLHLSLIVVRKDIQIPSLPSPPRAQTPSSPTPSITTSPARSLFNSATNFTKSLNRHSSRASLKSETSSIISSTTRSTSSASFSRTHWSSLPSSPRDRSATPPMSPSASSVMSETASPCAVEPSNPFGITLLHAATLTEKAEKTLRHIVAKAEKKYNIGSGWLLPSSTATSPTTTDLIRRSLSQNEVLFSSEGLTLLSLDHVYTFKCALHIYSTSLTSSTFSDAVDELRRLVLAQSGRRISKGYLMRAYEWLGVGLAALVDINEGYKVAYGGKERSGGIEVQNEERRSPPPLKTSFSSHEFKQISTADTSASTSTSGAKPTPASEVAFGESAMEKGIAVPTAPKEDRGPHMRGAVTPNGFEDITPVTRGEWCFLMVGEGWTGTPKFAAVETC